MTHSFAVKIVATKLFQRRAKKLFDTAALDALADTLRADPECGDIVSGLRGIRKVRVALPGRGKRGAVRVIYFFQVVRGVVFLLTAYTKSEKADLTPADRKALLRVVQTLEDLS